MLDSLTNHVDSIDILIVDNEAPARHNISTILKNLEMVRTIYEADSVTQAAELANLRRPHLIFLDIEMPRLDGFALLPLLTYNPHIVFITAYQEFAIRAFEINALDYLLKPIRPERLLLCLERFESTRGQVTGGPSKTIVRDGEDLHIIRYNNLTHIRSEGAYTYVYQKKFPPVFLRRSIREWEESLPSPPFERLDRSLILNVTLVDHIKQIHRDKSQVFLNDSDKPLILRRIASSRLKQLLNHHGR
ncbi:MAG: LytR/AlgR family response regulator transcription factor [Puniceicoccales bacterium]